MKIPGYKILHRIHPGSRTQVYKAIDEKTNHRPVTIKLANISAPTFEVQLQLRNHYATAYHLHHPQIIETYQLEPYQNSYALVMEDYGGVALGEWLNLSIPSIGSKLQIAIDLTDALAELNRQRIIHKNINPTNILVHPTTYQVKLIDFGIASLLPKETLEIRNPHILEGTLAYIAPEQTGRLNRGIDYRCDFYSLGVTLYELFTGELPFHAEDPIGWVHAHLTRLAVPAQIVNPELPKVIAEIVAKLMAKNPEDRYQSAIGIKYDLEECLAQLREQGTVEEFTIGQQDRRDRFLVSEQLYGRESEVQILLDGFERVAQGSTELVLVAGNSGIGKTAIINEIYKPITRQQGYFIKGKFDRLNRDLPLSALVRAARDLVGQLLSESKPKLAVWKSKILAAVGDNGQVLIDVIPRLKQIIGKQPPVPELTGIAAKNRLKGLFQKLIEVFATAEHPLTIFIDDLQWADLASLHTIELLMQGNGYLLLLGAYRHNEVSAVHPLMSLVADLAQAGKIVQTIALKPLTAVDIDRLVADTLHCSIVQSQPLAKLIALKTQGNPFFITQFLQALYKDGAMRLIPATPSATFDPAREPSAVWECDMVAVKALALTDDVVEFMTTQLQKLPPATQSVLKLAACIGSRFELDTLAIVSAQSPAVTAAALWAGLQAGLILPTSQVYKFFSSPDLAPSLLRLPVETEQPELRTPNSELPTPNSQLPTPNSQLPTPNSQLPTPTYRFLHDRVQQAAIALIPAAQKQQTHLQIGRLLLAHNPDLQPPERLFEIVNHLNLAIELITDRSERDIVADLNLRAAKTARTATAYIAAFNYAQIGTQLLGDSAWEQQYQLALELHENFAEAALLSGNIETLPTLVRVILDRALTPLDRVKAYETIIEFHAIQKQYPQAIELGLEILQQLGIKISPQPTKAILSAEFIKTKLALLGKSTAQLLNLPEITQPEKLAPLRILALLQDPAFFYSPELMALLTLIGLQLTLRSGNTPFAASFYAMHGVVMCGLGELNQAERSGRLAIELTERFTNLAIAARVKVMVPWFCQPWWQPLRATIPMLDQGFQLAIESGNLFYVGTLGLAARFYSGFALDEVIKKIHERMELVIQANNQNSKQLLELLLQTLLNLQQPSSQPHQIAGDRDEQLLIADWEAQRESVFLATFYSLKTFLAYLFEDIPTALIYADAQLDYEGAWQGSHALTQVWTIEALTRLAAYSESEDRLKKQLLDRVSEIQSQLLKRARLMPANFQHKYDLVAAEKCRVLGNFTQAMELFDRAIEGAKVHKYLQDEAIANELAAKFYLGWGKAKIATVYIQDAYACYDLWGATAKISDLEHRYAHLLWRGGSPHPKSLSRRERDFESGSLLPGGEGLGMRAGSGSLSPKSAELEMRAGSGSLSPESAELEMRAGSGSLLPESAELEMRAGSGSLLPEGEGLGMRADRTIDPFDLAAAIESTKALSSIIDLPTLIDRLCQIILKNSGAHICIPILRSHQHPNLWQAYKIKSVTSKPVGVDRLLRLSCTDLHDCRFLPLALIERAIQTGEKIILDRHITDPDLLADDYLQQHQPQSALCLPLINRGELQGIVYLENRHTAEVFTPNRQVLLEFIAAQAVITLHNAQLYKLVVQRSAAMETAVDGMAILENGRFSYINPSYARMYGYGVNELIGQGWQLLCDPADLETVEEAVCTVLATSGTWRGETIATSKDGSTFNIELTLFTIAEGQLISLCRDISAQKAVIQERQHQQDALAALVGWSAQGKTGSDFYHACTKYLAQTFDLRYAFLAKVLDDSWSTARLESFWTGTEFIEPGEIHFTGTACLSTYHNGWTILRENVLTHFPTATALASLDAESYVSVAIKDLEGNVLGNLGVIDTKPLPADISTLQFTIQLFANRIGAEIVRQASEDELSRSQQQIKAFIDNSPAVMYLKDLDGRYQMINQTCVDLGGGNPDLYIGKTDAAYYPPEIAQQIRANDLAIIQSGKSRTLEEIGILPDGTERIYISNKFVLTDETGKPYALGGVSTDITELKQTEIALRQSEARYQKLSDNIPGVIYQLRLAPDGQMTFPYMSSGCWDLFKLSPAAVMSCLESPMDLVHPDDIIPLRALMATSAQNLSPKKWEGRVILKTGETKWLKCVARPELQPDGAIIWDGMMLDVTEKQTERQERKRIAADLVSSQQKYYNLIQSVNGVVWEYDLITERFTFVSDRIVALLGYPIEQWLSQSNFWQDCIYPEDLEPTLRTYNEAIEYRYDCEFEYRMVTADDRIVWVYDVSTLVCDPDGNPISTTGLFINISDLKQVEAELHETNTQLELSNTELQHATRLKDAFLATMSHELRTPLNAILGMSQALQDQSFGSTNARQLKSLSTIDRNGRHLLSLINDILDISKIAAGKLELNIAKTSLRELCESSLISIEQQANDRQIQLDTHFPADLEMVSIDERRIRQVLINLLTNAVKFTPEGGSVSLVVVKGGDAEDGGTWGDRGDYIYFCITDTGIGIADDDLPKLFQPFIQLDNSLNRQYEGSGLGLSIVKQIVELHGGTVSVESEVGAGSCFTVKIPQSTHTPLMVERLAFMTEHLSTQNPDPDSNTAEVRTKTPLILLVEANEGTIGSFSSYLTAKGYRLIFARTGAEAIAATEIERPDVILLDLHIPDIDGFAVIAHIHNQPELAHIPIIALTDRPIEGGKEQSLALGASAYMEKPVKLRELDRTIQLIIDN